MSRYFKYENHGSLVFLEDMCGVPENLPESFQKEHLTAINQVTLSINPFNKSNFEGRYAQLTIIERERIEFQITTLNAIEITKEEFQKAVEIYDHCRGIIEETIENLK